MFYSKAFRRTLGVQSLEASGNPDDIIKGLSVGDLIGAGDEVYVVLYNDTSASDNDGNERGIKKGHVIVATVNGGYTGLNASGEEIMHHDEVHLFSFTTEYMSKKADLFWVYKLQ